MSWLSLILDGVMSVLLLVMITYSIKLNRLIGGLRERDAEIENLMVRFREASDQAEISVAGLKAAGVEAERTVRAATERAQAVRDEIMSVVERHGANAKGGMPAGRSFAARPAARMRDEPKGPAEGVFPRDLFEPDAAPEVGAGDSAPDAGAFDTGRSEAERDLLRAIRSARAGG